MPAFVCRNLLRWTPARITGPGEFRALAWLISVPDARAEPFRQPVRPATAASAPAVEIEGAESDDCEMMRRPLEQVRRIENDSGREIHLPEIKGSPKLSFGAETANGRSQERFGLMSDKS